MYLEQEPFRCIRVDQPECGALHDFVSELPRLLIHANGFLLASRVRMDGDELFKVAPVEIFLDIRIRETECA